MPNRFEFFTQLNLTLLTGRTARDLAQLVEHARVVPESVIYHHTHHFLVQHQYLSPEPPNDFAYWVANVLLEDELGEELEAVDVLRFSTLEELRIALIGVIESFIERTARLRVAPPGQEFNFMQTVSFVLPTGQAAADLRQFRDVLAQISLSSVSYHMFDARLRLAQNDNDFSRWLERELGEQRLAAEIRRIDPYTHTVDGLRLHLVSLVDERLGALRDG